MSKIADLIEVPAVKTVIQMADIEDPELRKFLTDSFLLTSEVKKVFQAFFGNVINNSGNGFFLEGNFGSGKSHLLTVISLLLEYEESWTSIIEQLDDSKNLRDYKELINKGNYLTVNISLVEHSSNERLEDIVKIAIMESLQQQNEKLQIDLETDITDNYKRKTFYQKISNILTSNYYQGIVILIDELSEFLRSKADGRSFNEDIRFLQFIGEFTQKANCWIMATLQEGIEKTGEITQDVFRKIKDRYKVHFYLAGTHIKEIVSKRLIRIKAGKENEILDIYKGLVDSFSDWPVEKDDFLSIYPINPFTIQLLDNLKPLFSQHRGIIDFIHFRLQGDPSRDIPSMLEKESNQLLSPELIFDHFLDRIRENMESRSYYEKVFRYYQQEIVSFINEEDLDTALRIIKLLILFAISPIEKKYTVKDIAHMLLAAITDLDDSVNYQYIDQLLGQLNRHGAYLVIEKADKIEDNIYFLDLKADVNLIIKQKTQYIKSNFFPNEQRLFTEPGKLIDEPYLPLSTLLENSESIRSINWQNTERQGILNLCSLMDISLKDIENYNKVLRGTGYDGKYNDLKDFAIFIAYPLQIKEQKKYLKDVILPELDNDERSSYAFLFPEELNKPDYLQDVLARKLLLDEYQTKQGETAKTVREKLQLMLKEDRNNLKDIFRDVFFAGLIIDGNGEEIINLKNQAILKFDDLLFKIADSMLLRRYPSHDKISPYKSYINDLIFNKICQHFLATGEISKDRANSQGILNTIDSYLAPMKIVKIMKQKLRLDIKPENNILLKTFFSFMDEEKTEVNELYLKLRKGNYGLSHPQFKILLFALIYSGYITAYSDKQKIALSQLSIYNYERIKYIGYGEIIAADFQEILANCSLLPEKYKKQTFSLPLQQEIWTYITELKRDVNTDVVNLKSKLTDLNFDAEMEFIDKEQLINYLEKLRLLLEEIKVSYSAEEGLERFAAAYANTPNIDIYYNRYKKIKEFLDLGYARYKEIENYLRQIPENLPSRDNYQEIENIKSELLDALQDQDIIFSKEFFAAIQDRFEYFRQIYAEEYYQDHYRKLSSERFKIYHSLKNAKSYQILDTLSEIEMISVKDDMIKVRRILEKILRQECTSLNKDLLYRTPICSCGFKPDDSIETISAEKIHNMLARGIAQYLSMLDSDNYREKIENYLDNMESIGEKRFARPIRDILSLAALKVDEINKDMAESLAKLLNRNIISRINKALEGSIVIVERDLNQLYENLIDRSFSLEQVQNIFNDWLEKGELIKKDSYIKIISTDSIKRNTVKQTDNRLESFLEELYPELLGYLDQLGEVSFSFLLALIVWYDQYNLNIDDLDNILDCSPDIIKEPNFETIYDLWDRVYNEESYLEIKNYLRNNIKKILSNDNLLEELVRLIPLGDLEDIILLMEKEFVSMELLRELLIILIKRTEKGLSEKSLILYIERLDEIRGKNSDTEKALYIQVCKNYLQLRLAIFKLGEEYLPATALEWDKYYRNYMSTLEYNLTQLQNLSEKLNLASRIPLNILSRTAQELLNNKMKEFYDFTQKNLFKVNEQISDYLHRELEYVSEIDLSALLLEKFPEMMKRINCDKSYCILIDGMRWDNWQEIKEKLKEKISFRLIKEGSVFASLPSNTETQLEKIKESGFRGDIVNVDDISISEMKAGNIRSINEIIKFSYIDDKVHTSKENYSDFMKEIIFQTENRLIPFLEKIAARSVVLIISDHGYRINYKFDYRQKYESPRYLHGGKSAHELIVPWALLYLL